MGLGGQGNIMNTKRFLLFFGLVLCCSFSCNPKQLSYNDIIGTYKARVRVIGSQGDVNGHDLFSSFTITGNSAELLSFQASNHPSIPIKADVESNFVYIYTSQPYNGTTVSGRIYPKSKRFEIKVEERSHPLLPQGSWLLTTEYRPLK